MKAPLAQAVAPGRTRQGVLEVSCIDALDLSVEELLAQRYAAGRRERGLGPDAPFAWDRGVGLDELEEAIDLAIYRRQRYVTWYGRNASLWPEIARERMAEALGQVETLRLELRHGPLGDSTP